MKRLLIVTLAFAMPAIAQQGGAAMPVPQVDPTRLAAARAVVDRFLPPDQHDRMVEQMLAPMEANITGAMASSPEMQALFENDPAMVAEFKAFMVAEQKRSSDLLRINMPMFADAISKAYARRFTVAQLQEIGGFFATPTGREYVAQSMTLMSDPDVQAAQRTMMTQAMQGMSERIAGFAQKAVKAKD